VITILEVVQVLENGHLVIVAHWDKESIT